MTTPAPEDFFAVGTNVRAVPREESLCQPAAGTIIHIKELPDHMEYFVRFNPPKDQRLSDWYRYPEMEFVSPVSQNFKTPKIHEVRNIEYIEMGNYKLRTWYFSPYPPPFNQVEKLFICQRCLKYARKEEIYQKHVSECKFTVPGIKIYEDHMVSVYEVDGRTEKLFCQFLCLFSKLFLDGKTLYYNTEHFVFYVMTIKQSYLDQDLTDMYSDIKQAQKTPSLPSRRLHTPIQQKGAKSDEEQLVGYFSKEKLSLNVLSCILTFPMYLRLGIGNLLMDFAYILARFENRVGGPEEPLSDLGEQSFKSYWKKRLYKYLIDKGQEKFGAFIYTETQNESENESQIEPQKTEDTLSMSNASVQSWTSQRPRYNRKQGSDFEVQIGDISYETGIIAKHVREACELVKAKIRKENIVLTKSYYYECCKQMQKINNTRAQKGNINRHDIDVKYLVWEPYPAMFQQMTDGGAKEEDGE
ncbi:Histone_acetyltransferase [Hexamita inflata]|uniref:histone acetyltransferase n=1 Tax=Hexamita inflata TaxID=28002 RepID=A0AA86P9E4_9EUKA|nr:Histone acetyltransferase [Hexamita inflata]